MLKENMNKIAKEAELARNVRVLVTRQNGMFEGKDIRNAIGMIDTVANEVLKLRKNSKGESNVTGAGEVLGNTMILNLTIPLDTRYVQNENDFNWGWANKLSQAYGVISGGYVETESQPVKNTVTIETDASPEEIAKLLGNFGAVIN